MGEKLKFACNSLENFLRGQRNRTQMTYEKLTQAAEIEAFSLQNFRSHLVKDSGLY